MQGFYASFHRPETFTLMRLLANAIALIETTTGAKWDVDPDTFSRIRSACVTILGVFRPGPGKGPRTGLFAAGMVATESKHLGQKAAVKVVSDWQKRLALIDILLQPKKERKPRETGSRS